MVVENFSRQPLINSCEMGSSVGVRVAWYPPPHMALWSNSGLSGASSRHEAAGVIPDRFCPSTRATYGTRFLGVAPDILPFVCLTKEFSSAFLVDLSPAAVFARARSLHSSRSDAAHAHVRWRIVEARTLVSTMPSEVVSKVVRTQMATAVNLVLVGPPGSGKGTQALQLAQAMSVPVISTGDILRKAAQDGSPTGRAVKAVMERGELIDDAMVTDIVAARLRQADTRPGCVLDGFPRTVDQAVALDRLTIGRGRVVVAELAVPEAALIRRLTMRRVCERCRINAEPEAPRCRCGGSLISRADDREDVVRERLRVYECATRPLVDFYSARRMLHVIDGTLAPYVVTARIRSAINASVGFELQQATVCE